MTIELFALLVTIAPGGGVAGCTTMAMRPPRVADRDQVAGIGAALRMAHPITSEPAPRSIAELVEQLHDV